MKKIYFDSRWCGEHGIGRFASEIRMANPDLIDVELNGHPAGKFDVIGLTYKLSKLNGIYFSPGYNAPALFQNKTIITIHDLNHIDFDANGSFIKSLYYNFIMKRACKNCLIIFTVSEFSKRRIVDWSGVSESKVVVVGNGVSTEFHNRQQPYSPGFRYIFSVGNRKPHKNEERTITAFATANIPVDIKLVFNGKVSRNLEKLISRLGISDRVVFTGTLTNNELASIYKGAEFLLFPSLYEGFGLPVVEAMSCGTPVITSSTTSLKEISGGAAWLVDPLDTDEITSAIENVYHDKKIRNELISKGIVRAKDYTWSNTVSKIKKSLDAL